MVLYFKIRLEKTKTLSKLCSESLTIFVSAIKSCLEKIYDKVYKRFSEILTTIALTPDLPTKT